MRRFTPSRLALLLCFLALSTACTSSMEPSDEAQPAAVEPKAEGQCGPGVSGCCYTEGQGWNRC